MEKEKKVKTHQHNYWEYIKLVFFWGGGLFLIGWFIFALIKKG